MTVLKGLEALSGYARVATGGEEPPRVEQTKTCAPGRCGALSGAWRRARRRLKNHIKYFWKY